MAKPENPLARRTVIKGAGLGLIAGAMAPALPVKAEDKVQEKTEENDGSEIWHGEYWAKKGDVPLWMFRKRLGAPKPGEPSRPGLFFVSRPPGGGRAPRI